MEQDPYEVLNLPPNATADQINEHFRVAVLGCHSDEFIRIRAAYAQLMDEERRREWEREGLIEEEIPRRENRLREESRLWEEERAREEERLAEHRAECERERIRRERRRRTSAPPPYESFGYGTCNTDPPPYSLPPASIAPQDEVETAPLFAHRSKGILRGFRRSCGRAAADCGSTLILVTQDVFESLATLVVFIAPFVIPLAIIISGLMMIILAVMGIVDLLGNIHVPSVHWPQRPPRYQRNIAIIGAGPAGVTTAYQLFRMCSQQGIPVHITIYEQSSHIGGRAVHTIGLSTGEILELGVNTFPKTARLLISAANNLGLETQQFSNGAVDLIGPSGTGSFGVYDGRSWALTEQKPHNFFDDYNWWPCGRWGSSPRLVSRLVKDVRNLLPYLHNPFTTLETLVASAGLQQLTQRSAEEILKRAGVSTGFQREQLNPWVRGRYAQNLGTISALAAFIAADNIAPLMTIHEDGDGRVSALWEQMVSYTGATLNLLTRVEHLTKASWGGWELTATASFNTTTAPFNTTTIPYDAVVLATPWALTQSHLSTTPPLSTAPISVAYTPLHITIFTSPFRLSPHPFHGNKHIPDLILTTPCSWEYTSISGRSGAHGLGQAPFWSLAVLKPLVEEGEKRWLYKLVSARETTDADIQRLVGVGHRFYIIHRHHAPAAYPLLPPRSQFSKIRLEENLWYTGAMDELATGVEWASISGANVATLVAGQWRREGVRLGVGRRIPVPPVENGTEEVIEGR